jgi:hypothetical protein
MGWPYGESEAYSMQSLGLNPQSFAFRIVGTLR